MKNKAATLFLSSQDPIPVLLWEIGDLTLARHRTSRAVDAENAAKLGERSLLCL